MGKKKANEAVSVLEKFIKDLSKEEREKLLHKLSKLDPTLSYTGPRDNNPPYPKDNPPVITVCKTGSFDSAHNNPSLEGKCQYLHGHTYRYELYIRGPINPTTGLVVDFRDMKVAMKAVETHIDHKYLNEVFDFATSCENLAIWMMKTLSGYYVAPYQVVKLRLWENETSFAEVTAEDLKKE